MRRFAQFCAGRLYTAPFDPKKLTVTTTDEKVDVPEFPDDLIFGSMFTPHMLVCDWDLNEGWGAPQIVPYGDLSIPPQSSVLHYGIECFEGMKAYASVNDSGEEEVMLFRPELNMQRFHDSCARGWYVDHPVGCFFTFTKNSMPAVDPDDLLEVIAKHIELEQDWIPRKKGFSLYIRPTMIGMDPTLGVKPPTKAKFFNLLSPVGPYFPEGFHPVKLLVDLRYSRASKGGTGKYKLGANYAPTIYPQLKAKEMGYDQLLWVEHGTHIVQEAGVMNFFVYWVNEAGEKELITCPLSEEVILPGVTRASVLELCGSKGMKVTEEIFTIEDLSKAVSEGRVLECFGTGTAAIIGPVESITMGEMGEDLIIPTPSDGLAVEIFEEILAIQLGEIDHEYRILLDDIIG